MRSAWDAYWQQVGGNILALPLQAVISVIVGVLLARPLRRAWHRIVGERADLEDLHRAAAAAELHAAAARRIMADLFEHHTGRQHRDAPPGRT